MGRLALDIKGKKFARLLVIERHYGVKDTNNSYWRCRCDCGNECIVRGNKLTIGRFKSCGCLRRSHRYKHGECKTRLYNTWIAMKKRCYNKNDKSYKSYGGKGIRVCSAWKNDYLNFRNWALSSGYKNNLTIDRISPNLGYCPDNCQWLPHYENLIKGLQQRYLNK